MFQRRPALAWLPIPALLALMVGLWVADWQVAWPQPFLYAVIHYAVAIAAVALIVIPAAGGFLANGQASLLMLGCGVLATDIGAAGAGLGFGRSLDTGFAIYNTSVLFSALCHLAGVTLASQRQTRVRPAATWLAGAYAGAVGVMGLVIWAAFAGRMPAFFIPGQGSTALRSMVVGLGAGGFALTARLLWRAHRRVPSPFLYWYALGLMLIAAGLTGSLVIALKDSPLQWVTRLTQSLGSIYLCVAALAAWRASGARAVTLDAMERAGREPGLGGDLRQRTVPGWLLRYGGAVAAVAVGWWLRQVLVAWIGPGLATYITFYPAVMLAALLAGFGPGLVATALADLVVAYWILPPVGQFAIDLPADRLGLAVFSLMGVLMSGVAHLYRRNRVKAAAYDQEAVLRETRREKEFLANLLEHASQPFAVGYPDGRMGRCNAAFEHLTGYSAAELAALDWTTVLTPPEWREREAQKLAELTRTGQPVRYEKEYLRKDGTRVPIELLVNLARDAQGRPDYYYCFLTDITERRRAEQAEREGTERMRQLNAELQATNTSLDIARTSALNLMDDAQAARQRAEEAGAALRESEERYRLLAEHADDFVSLQDMQGRQLYVSPSYCRRTGWTLEDLHATDWRTRQHPEDVERIERALAANLAGESNQIEHRIRCRDGSWLWVDRNCIPIRSPDGKVWRLLLRAHDITVRKQAEEALNRSRQTLIELIERSPFGTYVVDAQFRIAQMNAASQNGAFRNVRPLIGRPFDEAMRILWPEPVAAGIIAAFRHTLETGEPYYSPPFVNPRHDAEIVEAYEWELHRMTLPDGQYGVICYYYDSTKLRQAEAAERASRAKLAAAFGSMTEAIFIADAGGRLTDFNDEFVRYHRFKDRDECSRTIQDCPKYLEAYFADGTPAPVEQWAMPRALRGETASNVEYRLRRKETGETWWGSYNLSPIKDQDGGITGAIVSAREITALKQAEAALRDNARLLEDVINGSTFPIFLKDRDGRFITINAALERMMGQSRQELKGKTDYDIAPKEVADAWRANDVRVMEAGQAIQMEETADLPDGHHVFLADKFPLVDAQGRVYGVGAISHDITKRKRAEEALRESEERYRQLFQSLQEGFYLAETLFDDDGHCRDAVYLDANPAFERIMGRPRDQIIGKRAKELVPQIKPEWLEVFGQVTRTGVAVIHQAYSEQFHQHFEAFVFRPAPGRFGVLVTNITERKQAEDALRVSEERLRLVLQASATGTFEVDLRTGEGQWNDTEFELLGLKPGAAPANPETWFRHVHPEDIGTVRAQWEEALHTGKLEVDFRIVRADGEVRWMAGRGQFIFAGQAGGESLEARGPAVRFLGVNFDITARKQTEELLRQRTEAALHLSEQEFHSLAEAMPQIVWATRPDGWNIYFNQQWVDYTGMTMEESYGHGWNTPFHPDDKQRAWEAWQRATQHNDRYSLECRLRRHDGVYRWWLVRGEPMRGADGEILKWFGTCTDIEEIKTAEAALRDANERLEQRVAERTASLRSSEERLRFALETIHTGAWDLDLVDHTAFRSIEHDRVFGYAELLPEWTYEMFLAHVLPEDHAAVDAQFQRAVATQSDWNFECRIRRTDGVVRWILAAGRHIPDATGAPRRMAGIMHDITERKQREEELHRFNRALTALARSNAALAQATEEAAYLQEVCQIIVEDCGHAMVWIGYAEEDEARTVRPVASSGFEAGYLETLRVTWADTERGRGPTGTAIRTGQPCGCRNMLTDPAFAPWREQARQRGYASSLVLPLRDARRNFGALTIYARQPEAFSDHEVQLLSDLADDLATGITTLRLRAAQAQAEQTLRDNEVTLRGILNATQESVWLFSPEGRVLMANEVAFIRIGRPAAEVVGKLMTEILPPELARTRQAKLREAVASARSLDWEDERSGIQFHHSFYPVLDDQGRVVSVACFSRDITERKRAEAALRESEARFRSMFERHQAVMLLIHPDTGAIVDANPAALDFYGHSREQLRRMLIQDINQMPAAEVAAERQRATDEQRNYFVFPHLLADGRTRWVEVYSTPFETRDGPLLFSIIHDITERRQAEEALQVSERFNVAVLDSFPAHIAVLNRQGTILSVNARWQQFADENSDHSDPAVGVGSDYLAVCRRASQEGDALAQAALEGIQAVLDRQQPGFSLEYPCHSPHQERWFLLLATPIPSKSGRVILAHLDITERHRAQEDVANLNSRLRGILHALPVGVSFSDDITCRHITGNPAVLAQFGWTPEQNLSASAPDPSAPGRQVQFFREGRLISDAELPLQRAVAEKADIPALELEVLLPDGRRWLCEASGAPLRDWTGNVIGGVAVTVDITARQQAEERVRFQARLLEAVGQVVVATDLDQRVTYWNPAAARLFGWAPEEVLGRPLAEVTGLAPDAPPAGDVLARFRRGETWTHELPLHRRDGTPLPLLTTNAPVFNERGELTAVIGVGVDLSERKQMEDVLRFLAQCGTDPAQGGFFPELARYLAGALGMDFICIDRLEQGNLAARTLAMFDQGQFLDNVSYTLQDTPCGAVVGNRVCAFPRDIRRLFPKDDVLQQMRAERGACCRHLAGRAAPPNCRRDAGSTLGPGRAGRAGLGPPQDNLSESPQMRASEQHPRRLPCLLCPQCGGRRGGEGAGGGPEAGPGEPNLPGTGGRAGGPGREGGRAGGPRRSPGGALFRPQGLREAETGGKGPFSWGFRVLLPGFRPADRQGRTLRPSGSDTPTVRVGHPDRQGRTP